MKKLITVCQVLVIAVVVTSLAFGGNIINFDEAMVGANHPTLSDTLNRGFLTQHNSSGVHTIVPWSALTGVPTNFVESDNAAITGGSITGITDLAVADGGTGASTAAGARTSLGLGTIATQNDNAVSISGGTITGITPIAPTEGGTGQNSAGSTGFPYVLSGTWSFKSVANTLTALGLSPTDNVTFASIIVDQVNTTCSYADNTCGLNAASAGRIANPRAGDCGYDNTAKGWECYSGTSWTPPHAFGGFQLSSTTITIGSSSTWYPIKNVTDNLWVLNDGNAVAITTDNLVFTYTGDYTGLLTISISGTNGHDIFIRAYNVTQGVQNGYVIGGTATGAANFMPLTLPLYLNVTAGDVVRFEIENISAAANATVRSAVFTLHRLHH